LNIDRICTAIPIWKAMVEAKCQLGFLVHRHLMLVFAAHLRECTYTLVNPLVAVNLLAAARRWRWSRSSLSNDCVNVELEAVSNLK
jgi:hypothetical protein